MKKEITIYYKDSCQDEYVTRRVLTQDGNYYKLTSYWKIGKKIETYVSGLKLTKSEANKYILQCRKENRFDHFEYQFVMWGDLMNLNHHDYELIILGLSYLQLHLQKQYENEKDKTKKDKIYYEHIEISRLSDIMSKRFIGGK